MSVVIGIATETDAGERRLAVVPDVVKRYRGLGAEVVMQAGAGGAAHFRDKDFPDATIAADMAGAIGEAGLVLASSPHRRS